MLCDILDKYDKVIGFARIENDYTSYFIYKTIYCETKVIKTVEFKKKYRYKMR